MNSRGISVNEVNPFVYEAELKNKDKYSDRPTQELYEAEKTPALDNFDVKFNLLQSLKHLDQLGSDTPLRLSQQDNG